MHTLYQQQQATAEPTSPGSKSVEVYGFVSWVACLVAGVIYLAWAFIPDRYLREIGITYYPSKWWAVVIPTLFLLIIFWTAGVILPFLSWALSPPLTDKRLIEDPSRGDSQFISSDTDESSIYDIPTAVDLKLSEVNAWKFREFRLNRHRRCRDRNQKLPE
ncbi:Phosphatidylinositol N-acetylglucosaminyltransferase subunit P, putative [Perkinsus marinus ATCC 50983]|uniref:Phosphatidylinositol N-acetylglucosaminyltransferase subunit P, putative n=1 Tax=Perkinsus marinus (strain ATCC 50983 / TXsc) TaxID=423536 RepID=C5KDX7_PERM5|nr:Phosphatidylinositol N-acetylglucosaminyltransferase subunit P, putative [Perkinsus marinus ATCC 50983]EER17430.1 Phosphatidylinositol N-acetylglucosaminyltransferase subunit P, putative [Perkinsus marinus ATCC 50983]|eukprot:XP_002785634.1 Phosphatidylinositol N-acetylglucosaminyltransferase subunit P, putative [Perkinsus marinus ATCC 50983]